MQRGDLQQLTLNALGLIAAALFGIFFYREVFPEYREYQNRYVALEEFRSSYTNEPPPAFKPGVKQIVFEREDGGPAAIDRCISCHVAVEFPHFSPTKIAYDINGNMLFDERGNPVQIPNENYIWSKLDQKIAALKTAGNVSEAETLAGLKVVKMGDHTYDATMALRAHPLMGREVRPFEYHPLAEYGCTSCHNGNGRGLTVQKAHGPVFDGDYETEFTGPTRTFLESDPANDPKFSRVFNGRPGHDLLFQTTPLYVGSLIQSKCMNCHQSSAGTLQTASQTVKLITDSHLAKFERLQKALNSEEAYLISLVQTRQLVEAEGVAGAVSKAEEELKDLSLQSSERQQLLARIDYLKMLVGGEDGLRPQNAQPAKDVVFQNLDRQMKELLGSEELVQKLNQELEGKNLEQGIRVDAFITAHEQDKEASGSLFKKYRALAHEQSVADHIQETKSNIFQAPPGVTTDIDFLTQNYARGQELFIVQACYACHRIAGLSRGGIGPELTHEGKTAYPWYIKQKIVWPQSDLSNSTMPNYRLDHVEVEDLMTFMLAQTGENKAVSESLYKSAIKDWEAGKKMPWEEAVSPLQTQDVNYAMTVFATEGCAACHRLKGFQSNVGFHIEKDNPDFEQLYAERLWFQKLIPEMALGSQIVSALDEHGEEIDQRIIDNVRENSLLEKIAEENPEVLESFYAPFRFASRAKNSVLTDPNDRAAWKARVNRVLMMYIQEYGLGRYIGPKPNWSGVYRTDQWLMEHFHNPSAHIARSIMPIFPFDDSKFYALTHMLNVLGIRNRDAVREIWKNRGFSPELAFQIHCAQCHGEFLAGNGPVSEWIYPIPKNLRNADFLRNLTKERVVNSIIHGVHGTPMAPWGEAPEKSTSDGIPVITRQEAERLADWIFQSLPGGTIIRRSQEVPKWQYEPQDVIEDLKKEGSSLKLQDPLHSMLGLRTDYLVALRPPPLPAFGVDDLFVQVENTPNSPEPNSYYIKRDYYTPENLRQGQLFFEANCAVCHGKEGDGTGARGAVMQDAKPRMLTNLDWIQSRDDLRLLRSIKFGIAGTSMAPWGDQTTALQRLQMVMYIRSMTESVSKKRTLSTTLYDTFNPSQAAVEEMRVSLYPKIKDLKEAVDRQQRLLDADPALLDVYEQKLSLMQDLDVQKSQDRLLLNLQETLLQEKKVYQDIGLSLIGRPLSEQVFEQYLDLVSLNRERIRFKEGRLVSSFNAEEEVERLQTRIVRELDDKISMIQAQIAAEEGKIASLQRSQEIAKLQTEVNGYNTIKRQLLSGLREAAQLRHKQDALIEELVHGKI